jgi:heme iron utilization protein
MAQENKSTATSASAQKIAAEARNLVRRGVKGTLATLDAKRGYPYASLITLATDQAGAPVFLISSLALHTQNLAKDDRASILIDGTGATGDPLEGARLTLFGRAEKAEDEAVRRRFLARHPEAAVYADFKDFAFYRLDVEGAHFIGGFGRIVDIPKEDLLIEVSNAKPLLEAEPGVVEHMNDDHADALRLYATVLADGPEGDWRMTGIDPEGCDLVWNGAARRIGFQIPVTNAELARQELVRLVKKAREQSA